MFLKSCSSTNFNNLIHFIANHSDFPIIIKKFSTLRSSITLRISQKFENVSLDDFPLEKVNKNFKLSKKFAEIENANSLCFRENLDDNPNYYPSITTILNQTMSVESLAALKKWEAEKIKQLGQEGFEMYRKELFIRGRLLHNNIRTYLETKNTSNLKFVNKTQENMWKSIENVLSNINILYASEFPVYHPILKFRGILDSLATYQDQPTIIEWKTSEKLRPTLFHTYDNPLQAVAYYSCLQFNQQQYDNNKIKIPKNIKEVLLVIAYEDGTKASVHLIEPSLRKTIWKKFLKRLELYWIKTAQQQKQQQSIG